jgi:hypothetical protein
MSARRESLRKAAAVNQRSDIGRIKHRQRQARYRELHRVTQQGSLEQRKGLAVTLLAGVLPPVGCPPAQHDDRTLNPASRCCVCLEQFAVRIMSIEGNVPRSM